MAWVYKVVATKNPLQMEFKFALWTIDMIRKMINDKFLMGQWIAEQAGRIRLFLLPGYSPELNPDELVWNSLKNHGLGKRAYSSKNEMKKIAISHMRRLQKMPEVIKGFFRKPSTIYAAA